MAAAMFYKAVSWINGNLLTETLKILIANFGILIIIAILLAK